MLKDEEIYNIFDTGALLDRPALVSCSNTSGLAGIAYWINVYFNLKDNEKIDKKSDLVLKIKEWIDKEYESGRQTVISDEEMLQIIDTYAPGKYVR